MSTPLARRRVHTCIMIVSAGLLALASGASAGRIVDGVLTVDGKPFYPLGSWPAQNTTLDDIERLGLNVAFKSAPGDERGVAEYREWMREADRRGLQVIPFLSYGGATPPLLRVSSNDTARFSAQGGRT